MERLVGARTIADLKKRILPAGLRDVQDWTGITLTFMRRGDTGWYDVVTAPVISMPASNSQPLQAIGGLETSVRKTLTVWADDVADENGLKQGDRFNHDGHVCIVQMVHPPRLDTYVRVEYTMLEGN